MPKHEIDTHACLFDGTAAPLADRLMFSEKAVVDRVAAMRDEEVTVVDADVLGAKLGREFALRVPRLDLPSTRVERTVLDTEMGLLPNSLRVSIPFSGDGSLFGLPLPTLNGDSEDWRLIRWSVENSELHLYAGLAGEDRTVGIEQGAELGAALRGLQAALRTLEDSAAIWNATIPVKMHQALDGRQAALRAKADYLAAFREAMLEAAVLSLAAPEGNSQEAAAPEDMDSATGQLPDA